MQPGVKPTPPHLKGIKGGKKSDGTEPPKIEKRTEPLKPPKRLLKAQQELWDRYIDPAWWLTEADTLLAYAFVCLQAEFLKKPADMATARITEMRRMMSELHLTSAEQARLGVTPAAKDPAEAFFD